MCHSWLRGHRPPGPSAQTWFLRSPPHLSSRSLLSWLSAVEPAISAPSNNPASHTAPNILPQHPQPARFPLSPSTLTPSSHQPYVVSLFWDKSPIKQPSCRTGNSWGGAVRPWGQLCTAGGGALPPPSCQLSGGTQLPPDNTSAGCWEFALPPPLPSVVKTALISLFCSSPPTQTNSLCVPKVAALEICPPPPRLHLIPP